MSWASVSRNPKRFLQSRVDSEKYCQAPGTQAGVLSEPSKLGFLMKPQWITGADGDGVFGTSECAIPTVPISISSACSEGHRGQFPLPLGHKTGFL